MADITAIIVSYNSQPVLGACIASLQAQPELGGIIVVDNCSSDDSCDYIRQHFPDITLIENPQNEGFGRANNVALAETKTGYALLINPDATLEEGCLKALLEAARQYEDAAILAPQLYDESGTLLKTHKQNVFAREKVRGTFHPPAGDVCADFLSGAVWLVNMKHLRQIGFFDKQIFLYYEDDDLCLRVRAAGLGVVLVHNAKARHNMGTSSGPADDAAMVFRQEHMAWSRIYMEFKYHGKQAALKLAHKRQLEYSARAAFYCLCLNGKKVKRYRARIRGLFDCAQIIAKM